MNIHGKSRGVATVIAIAFGLAVTTTEGFASAQMAPTGVTNTQPAPKTGQPTPNGQPPAKSGPTTTPSTPAKPADPKALLASGEKKLKANDSQGALSDFEASETAKASPEAEYGIGQAHDKLGHFAEAATAYEKFIGNVPASMKTQGDDAKKRVEAIKAMPGKIHLESTPPGAQVLVDLAPRAPVPAGPNNTTPPTPTDLELPAGRHTIKLSADGYTSVDKEVEVTYGSKQDVRVDLVKSEPAPPVSPPVIADTAAQPPPPPPPPPEPRSKVPAFVTGAVAVVAAGIGIGFGVAALGQSSDFKNNPTTKTADDGENNALVADMMFGIAITFGVTSAVLFLSGDAPQAAKADPSGAPKLATVKKKPAFTITPTPYVTSTGGGAGAVVRF